MGTLLDPSLLPIGLTSRRTTSSSSSISLSSTSAPVSTSSSSSVSSTSISSSSAISTSSTSSAYSTTSSTETVSSSSSSPAVTTVVVDSPSIAPPANPATPPGSNTSFLQNKVASGFVFAIVGLVGFVIIIYIATFFIKRRSNHRLMRDAVSFDPVTIDRGDLEKANQSSLGHGSHDAKSPSTDDHYSSPSSHYHASPPPTDNHHSTPPSQYSGAPPTYNHYSPPSLHYPGSSPGTHPHHSLPANYTPQMAAQLYAPPVRYSSPPLPPLPMQQQPSHLQRHLSSISAMSSAEEANYSRLMSEEMRGSVGGQIPDGIRRQYSTQ